MSGGIEAWEVSSAFGLENLKRVTRERRALGEHEMRLSMRAVSLNYRDLLMVKGLYNPRQPLPLIPLSDGVGEVVEVGALVSRFSVGDRVCPTFAPKWIAGEPERDVIRSTLGGPLDGTLCSEMVVSEEGAVKAPDHLSDEEAATLPCAALTAWSALSTLGPIRAGDTVLVMGTGGVSIFACQLSRCFGARVLATSSSDEKLERLSAFGVADTINYRTNPDWGKEVRARTDGRGVDLVVEVGGAATLPQSLRAVRPGGTLSMIGNLGSGKGEVNVLPILMNQVKLQGVLVGHREGFDAMNRAISAHQITPVVDRVFSFEEAPAAFAHLASGEHFGKVAIRLGA